MEKVRVFIVDEHPVICAGLKTLLSREYDIDVIGDSDCAENALKKINHLDSDVIIVDISLPDMSGISFIKQLLLHKPEYKILVFTERDNTECLQEIIKTGVKGYIHKKASEKEIINAVRSVADGNIFIHSNNETLIDSKDDILSSREKEVLLMLAKGMVNKEIAQKLFLSVKTIETYRARIMYKLNLTKRTDITDYAIRSGMLKLSSV